MISEHSEKSSACVAGLVAATAARETGKPRNGSVMMGIYFKPWRRKIGVVTLAMACVFAAWWARSYLATDMIVRETPSARHFVMSEKHGIVWYLERFSEESGQDDLMISFGSAPEWNTGIKWDWERRLLGFRVGGRQASGNKDTFWIVPHWAITIPLTLLSTWLLISQPRTKANPAIEATGKRA